LNKGVEIDNRLFIICASRDEHLDHGDAPPLNPGVPTLIAFALNPALARRAFAPSVPAFQCMGGRRVPPGPLAG
jgi:hypothetical protein